MHLHSSGNGSRYAARGALVLALTAALTLHPSARGQEPIRVSVKEVIVPVTVTDGKGRFVSNLAKSDFKLFDEGREQKIDFFSHEQSQPIVIGFLIDTSNGMKIHWDKYKEAATRADAESAPGEKQYSGYLITYGNEAGTGGRHEQRFREDGGEDAQDQAGRRVGACSTRFIWPAPAAKR